MLKEEIEKVIDQPLAAGPTTTFFINRVWAPWGDRVLEIWLEQWTNDFERLAPGRSAFDLSHDSVFRSTSAQIARMVVTQGDLNKLRYFRNALLNVAIGKNVPSDLKLHIFLNAIESLSREHVEVLNVIRQPKLDKRPSENSFVMGLGQGCHDSLVQAVLNELRSRGLLEDVGPDEVFPKGIPYAITNLGIEFLNFILKPFPQ